LRHPQAPIFCGDSNTYFLGHATDSRMQFAVDLSGYMTASPTSDVLPRLSNFAKSDQHNPGVCGFLGSAKRRATETLRGAPFLFEFHAYIFYF
jgi:hypothetical protein